MGVVDVSSNPTALFPITPNASSLPFESTLSSNALGITRVRFPGEVEVNRSSNVGLVFAI